MTEDERLEYIDRALSFVPHNLYDEITKLAELALGEFISDRDRLANALDAIERELGTLPLDHFGPATERAVSKAWAMAREKRPDPELIPAPIDRAALARTENTP